MIGRTLSHFKITGKLGEGGMGEVYRAEDTKLRREVALKVLPEAVVGDSDRLARFEREAKVLASLNHPNIASIYSLEVATAGTAVTFLVMELAEGQDLAVHLSRGPIPVSETLEISLQIAHALEAAHEKGIIHRDLKPANVTVAPSGKVKVLDFGLAKALHQDPHQSESVMDMSPTLTAPMTDAGVILGTAAYMSPEQAKGHEVDRRTDIWSFGVLMWEMLAGKRLFVRDSFSETQAAVLRDEIEADSLPPDTPVAVHSLLDRCLDRNQDSRLRDIGEARIALERELGGEQHSGLTTAAASTGIPRKLVVAISVASALLAAFAVWITIPSRPEPPQPIVSRFQVAYPPETTFRATSTLGVAISPDGKFVVFSADRQLWLRALDDLVATPIRGTEQARSPFFSPDGQQLGFWGGDGQMKSVSVTGGVPVPLGPAPEWAYGASWAADGYIYFGQGAGGIFRVSENGGEPEAVVEMEGGEQAHGPQLLPGGEWLLFTLRSGSSSWDDASIVAQPISGGEPKVLVAGGTDGRYVPTGHIVYSLDGNLLAVPFDDDSLEVTGGSVSIVKGVQQATSITGASQYAFSDRGGLVYIPGGGAAGAFQLAWAHRSGQVELLSFEPSSSLDLDLSPDGQRIALEIQGAAGQWNIWIYEVERGGSQVLLTTESTNQSPVWSPDGEWVFFASDRGGKYDIWRKRADRSLDAELILDTEAPARPSSISADGEMLLFTSGPTSNRDVGVLALNSDQEPDMLVATAADERGGIFSPDGRFFAFYSNETGQYAVNVMEVSSGRRFSISTSTHGGALPRWSQNGSEIYYNTLGSSGILGAEVEMEPFFASEPVELLDIVMRIDSNFDVTADGQRFLVTVPVGGGETEGDPAHPRINVILNWFEELKERVPSDGR